MKVAQMNLRHSALEPDFLPNFSQASAGRHGVHQHYITSDICHRTEEFQSVSTLRIIRPTFGKTLELLTQTLRQHYANHVPKIL